MQIIERDAESRLQRMRLTSRGAIQGVGCRLLLYRLARTLGLTGWVRHQGAYHQVRGVAGHGRGPGAVNAGAGR